MKNLTRCAAVPILALGLGLSLTACGGAGLSKFEAAAYVDGLLKETYLGEFDPGYLKLVDIDETEAQAAYDSGLEVETDYFLSCYGIEYPTDELRREIKELYAGIYSHAKFEVVSAAEQDDGSYSVKVQVKPIDIVQLVDDAWEEGMAEFYSRYPAEVQDAVTGAEYKAMDQEWAKMVVALYQAKLPETGNEAARSITVQLEPDADGCYGLPDEDFSRLDELIIDYSGIFAASGTQA